MEANARNEPAFTHISPCFCAFQASDISSSPGRVESRNECVRESDVALEGCSHTVVRDSPPKHLLSVSATTREPFSEEGVVAGGRFGTPVGRWPEAGHVTV